MKVRALEKLQYNHKIIQAGEVFEMEDDHPHFAGDVYGHKLDATGKELLIDGKPVKTLIARARMEKVPEETPIGSNNTPEEEEDLSRSRPKPFKTAAEVFDDKAKKDLEKAKGKGKTEGPKAPAVPLGQDPAAPKPEAASETGKPPKGPKPPKGKGKTE